MFRNSVFITLLSLSSSVVGFFVQLLLAQRFGLGVEVEAYFFSLSVPIFIAGMASAMMSYAVVPRLLDCEKDAIYHRRYMGSLLIGVTTVAFTLMGILTNILGKWQIYSLPPESQIRLYRDLPLLLLLACLIGACMIVQGCLSTMLNSVRLFIPASAFNLLPYFGMLILLLGLNQPISILAAPIGMLSGIFTGILCGVFMLRRYLFPLPWKHIVWGELGKLAFNSPYTAVAMSCFSSHMVVDAYWAPHAGQGTLAAVGYAQRVVVGFGSIIVAGPSAVLIPRMSEFVREGNYQGFRQFLFRALMVIGGVAIGIALPLMIFAEKLIGLLFARGAFGQEDIVVVAATLRCMAPAIVGMLISIISLRALFCFYEAEKIAAALGLMWTTLYFLISYFLHEKGAVGLATGYSLVWAIFSICVVLIIFYKYAKKEI
jgi:putative peptidoglycan lipid II flippase